LGYNVFYKILNSSDFGIPQNRERIFIVCFRNKSIYFDFPKPSLKNNSLKKILDKKKSLSPSGISKIAVRHVKKHFENYKKKAGKKFDQPVLITEIRPSRCSIRADGISPCLTAKMGTGGNNVPYIINYKRVLSIRECLRLQGFPETFEMTGSKSQNYKQIGNSIAIPVVEAITKKILENL
jgi:DNA (cytosine-5)-methyltransferase 1